MPREIRKLYRSSSDSVIAGVCGGLGLYFEIDPVLVRIIFVIFTFFGGGGIVLYIILWIVIPQENTRKEDFEKTIRKNVEEIKGKAKTIASEIRRPAKSRDDDSKIIWGVFIVLAGFLLLLNNFGFYGFFDFSKVWPIFLIILGIFLLLRKNK